MRLTIWNKINCEFGTGSWAVIDGFVHVNAEDRTASARLTGNNTAEIMARLLMWELSESSQAVA